MEEDEEEVCEGPGFTVTKLNGYRGGRGTDVRYN